MGNEIKTRNDSFPPRENIISIYNDGDPPSSSAHSGLRKGGGGGPLSLFFPSPPSSKRDRKQIRFLLFWQKPSLFPSERRRWHFPSFPSGWTGSARPPALPCLGRPELVFFFAAPNPFFPLSREKDSTTKYRFSLSEHSPSWPFGLDGCRRFFFFFHPRVAGVALTSSRVAPIDGDFVILSRELPAKRNRFDVFFSSPLFLSPLQIDRRLRGGAARCRAFHGFFPLITAAEGLTSLFPDEAKNGTRRPGWPFFVQQLFLLPLGLAHGDTAA